MEIIAFGNTKAECKKCRESEAIIEAILKELGAAGKVKLEKVTINDPRAGKHGILVTPSVVIDGQKVVDGRVPDKDKLKAFIAGKLKS